MSSSYNLNYLGTLDYDCNYRHTDIITKMIRNSTSDITFKAKGWFPRNQYIIKHMNQNKPYNNMARCLYCYNMTTYDKIQYARIISNGYNNESQVLCVCSDCHKKCCGNFQTQNLATGIQSNKTEYLTIDPLRRSNRFDIKPAPRHYGDILADYIQNGKYDLITQDIKLKIDSENENLQNRINTLKFNINEKKVIINSLENQNAHLSRNIETEIEKHSILKEHKAKNQEVFEKIKESFTKLSIDLFRIGKQQIDAQISKYNELVNYSKYNIPECKICMQREVNLAIQCGHTLCNECYHTLESTSGNITCPTCRTVCNSFAQIYL